jgi:hypothetical protein
MALVLLDVPVASMTLAKSSSSMYMVIFITSECMASMPYRQARSDEGRFVP